MSSLRLIYSLAVVLCGNHSIYPVITLHAGSPVQVGTQPSEARSLPRLREDLGTGRGVWRRQCPYQPLAHLFLFLICFYCF